MAEIMIMPKLGFDMAEGKLVRWVKAEGEPVAKGEVLAEIETDKATVEVEAQAEGVVRKHLVAEGTMVPVGAPIAVIGDPEEEIDLQALLGEAGAEAAEAPPAPTPEEAGAPQPAAAPPKAEARQAGTLPGGVRASPVARRLAAEHGIDLQALQGSGPGGRIRKRDVEAAIAAAVPEAVPAPAPTTPPPLAMPTERPPSERVPLSRLRSIIGQRMTAAKQQVPHFYLTADLDAGPLMDLRAELNARLPENEKLSVNDFFVRAAALALRRFPNLNASLEEGRIVRHGAINIGIAVAVENGLLTVVVHDADLKPLRLISLEARGAVERARLGRVRPEDMEGSTFTLSNLGMFDIDHFIAIINPPEAAILALGSVREEPVVEAGQIKVGRRVKVTLSADHRVTDGAEAAQWLQVFRAFVEDPLSLLL